MGVKRSSMRKILGNYLLISITTLSMAIQESENMSKKIAVVGTGYVGLVSGTGFAEVGHSVTCADIVKSKIESLRRLQMPIYEPGLAALVEKNVQEQRLKFTHDVAQAIEDAEVIFIAVGTPMAADGKADLTYVEVVAQTIGQHLKVGEYKVIVNKSTVPIGMGKKIKALISSHAPQGAEFDVVSNPEFLREGSAVYDFLKPDRIVVGCSSTKAQEVMAYVYEPFIRRNIPIIYTTIETAETIKYASNSFLATKIAFINEISRLCDKTGADVTMVAKAMGLDHRISPYFLRPGPGFGGSCFPKDVSALAHIGDELDLDLTLVKATLESNTAQKKYVVDKLTSMAGGTLRGKSVAVLGLAFKANTDDVRDSSACFVIEELLKRGAQVHGYDPEAITNMKNLYPKAVYYESVYDCLRNTDAAVILTEWDEIKALDLEKVAELMNQCVLLDMRNLIDPKLLTDFNSRSRFFQSGLKEIQVQ